MKIHPHPPKLFKEEIESEKTKQSLWKAAGPSSVLRGAVQSRKVRSEGTTDHKASVCNCGEERWEAPRRLWAQENFK